MLLTKLILNNFRQYKGEQEIEFSKDPDQNVTVLLGINSSGKTTFVQAFRWVLYGDDTFASKKAGSSLINQDAMVEMRKDETQDVSVTLDFTHKGIDYEVVRTARFKSYLSGTAKMDGNSFVHVYYYDEDGQKKEAKQAEVTISEILPDKLSEFFFFDGEKIAQSTVKENVEESINAVMGLTPLKKMTVHLNENYRGSAVSLLRSDLQDDNSHKLEDYQKTISNLEKDITVLDEKKVDHIKNAKTCKAYLDQYADQIEEIGKRSGRQEELGNYLRMRIIFDQAIERSEKQLFVDNGQLCLEQYLAYLFTKVKPLLNKEDYSKTGIPEMTGNSIRFLLERGKCVCGSDLSLHPECKAELIEALSYLPPESIGTQVKNYLSSMSSLQSDYLRLSVENADHINTNVECITNRDDNETNIIRLSNENTDVNAKNIKNSYDNTEKQYYDENRQAVECERKSSELSTQKENLLKEMGAYSKQYDFNKEVNDEIDYVRALYKKADYEYKVRSEENLKEMRATLTEVFNSMYHGKRQISLDDHYRILLTVNTYNLDPSKGIETVENFAFIASLLKMAKEHMKNNDDGISSEPFPLVMDAVFSNTDDIHINNICTQLPTLSEQAVLAIMDKDWKYANEPLGSHVGCVYRIRKISESCSSIEKEA